MVKKNGMGRVGRERSGSNPAQQFLKIFIFPLQKASGEVCQREGRAGGKGAIETEAVLWSAEGCWTGMCFASVLDSRQQKANGPKMIAHLQLPELEISVSASPSQRFCHQRPKHEPRRSEEGSRLQC